MGVNSKRKKYVSMTQNSFRISVYPLKKKFQHQESKQKTKVVFLCTKAGKIKLFLLNNFKIYINFGFSIHHPEGNFTGTKSNGKH